MMSSEIDTRERRLRATAVRNIAHIKLPYETTQKKLLSDDLQKTLDSLNIKKEEVDAEIEQEVEVALSKHIREQEEKQSQESGADELVLGFQLSPDADVVDLTFGEPRSAEEELPEDVLSSSTVTSIVQTDVVVPESLRLRIHREAKAGAAIASIEVGGFKKAKSSNVPKQPQDPPPSSQGRETRILPPTKEHPRGVILSGTTRNANTEARPQVSKQRRGGFQSSPLKDRAPPIVPAAAPILPSSQPAQPADIPSVAAIPIAPVMAPKKPRGRPRKYPLVDAPAPAEKEVPFEDIVPRQAAVQPFASRGQATSRAGLGLRVVRSSPPVVPNPNIQVVIPVAESPVPAPVNKLKRKSHAPHSWRQRGAAARDQDTDDESEDEDEDDDDDDDDELPPVEEVIRGNRQVPQTGAGSGWAAVNMPPPLGVAGTTVPTPATAQAIAPIPSFGPIAASNNPLSASSLNVVAQQTSAHDAAEKTSQPASAVARSQRVTASESESEEVEEDEEVGEVESEPSDSERLSEVETQIQRDQDAQLAESRLREGREAEKKQRQLWREQERLDKIGRSASAVAPELGITSTMSKAVFALHKKQVTVPAMRDPTPLSERVVVAAPCRPAYPTVAAEAFYGPKPIYPAVSAIPRKEFVRHAMPSATPAPENEQIQESVEREVSVILETRAPSEISAYATLLDAMDATPNTPPPSQPTTDAPANASQPAPKAPAAVQTAVQPLFPVQQAHFVTPAPPSARATPMPFFSGATPQFRPTDEELLYWAGRPTNPRTAGKLMSAGIEFVDENRNYHDIMQWKYVEGAVMHGLQLMRERDAFFTAEAQMLPEVTTAPRVTPQ